MALELNSKNFKSEVTEFQGGVLVDFWAPWCGPCRMMGPIIDSLAGKFTGKVKIAKLNVDDAADIAASFNVSTIPTLIFSKIAKPVTLWVGELLNQDSKIRSTASFSDDYSKPRTGVLNESDHQQ